MAGAFDTLTEPLLLPLDLHPIGIDASLDYTNNIHWDSIQEVRWTAEPPFISNSMNLMAKPTLLFGNGKMVSLTHHLGTGAYGYVFRGTLDGIDVAVKFEGVGSKWRKGKCCKEILVHHYIHTATSVKEHADCSYAGKVYTVGRMRGYLRQSGKRLIEELVPVETDISVIVMELAVEDAFTYLAENPSSEVGTQVAMKIARKLERLWELYKFNHCDLHISNVLIYPDGNIRLGDFGMSRIILGGAQTREIEVDPAFKYIYTAERDMIIFLFSIHHSIHVYPCKEALKRIINTMDEIGISDNMHALYGEIGRDINIRSCTPANLLIKYNSDGPINEMQSIFPGRPFRDLPCMNQEEKPHFIHILPESMPSPGMSFGIQNMPNETVLNIGSTPKSVNRARIESSQKGRRSRRKKMKRSKKSTTRR